MATALTLATQARRVKTRDPSNILNDKSNGIYILPTAPMPTEKLITYLPTYDNTIVYVMITLVSINLMILLYKFLTRKLQHSTIVLELSTGHRCITLPLINVPLCPKMYHYLARENFSHMKVELDLCYCGKEVKLLLWISWTILSCNSSQNLCLSMARNQTKKNTETIGLLLCKCSTWISCESLSCDMYYMRTCFHECCHSTHRSNWANSSLSASIRHWNRNRESSITKNEKQT